MGQKAKINVEGGEILIRNTNGDYAVIPKKDVEKVTRLIKERCFDCIDNYVSTLPRYSDYAEDGTLIPRPSLSIADENNIEEANIEEIDNQPLVEETQENTVEKVEPKTKEKSETELEGVPDYIRDAISEQLRGSFSKKRKTEELTQKYVSFAEEEKRKTLEQGNELYNKISKIAKETSSSSGEIDSKISKVISEKLEAQKQTLTPKKRKELHEEFKREKPVPFTEKVFSNIVALDDYYKELGRRGYPKDFADTLYTFTRDFPSFPGKEKEKYFIPGGYKEAKEYLRKYFPGIKQEFPEKTTPVEIEYPSGRIDVYIGKKIREALEYMMEHGAQTKLDPAYIGASLAVEGGNKLFKKYFQNSAGVYLYGPFGGDTIGDKYPRLKNKGYLPPDFSDKVYYTPLINDSKDNPIEVLTGYVPDLGHALWGLSGLHKYFEDKVEEYAKEKNISLTDDAIRFLTFYGYNAGEGGIDTALDYFYQKDLLKDNRFLNLKKEDLPDKMQKPYHSAITKLKLAKLYKEEGLFPEQENYKPDEVRKIRKISTKEDAQKEARKLKGIN